jgi:pimeloyl-CoA synthetase
MYEKVIKLKYPDLEMVMGTHKLVNKEEFQRGVKELLCQTISKPQTMNDMVKNTLELPDP